MHDLVKLAAENQLMVNIHDEYRPSGFSRTYPNLLTQEGIRGNEEFPDATHNKAELKDPFPVSSRWNRPHTLRPYSDTSRAQFQ